ncbi:MAG: MlaD family protein [Solirubrobacteraceae bacterium]|nr:MlaD family protein [Solirubrobacteraceae bacterium]
MTARQAPGRHHSRGPLIAALVVVAVLAGVSFYAFGRQSVLQSGTTVHVTLRDTSQLRKGNPVRVAGLDIGRVTGIAHAADGQALVTVRLKSDAPVLRAQDRWTVRPRLPFEGNFYIDVGTGATTAAPLRDGDTVPVRLTSRAVQLDEVLTTLDAPVRERMSGLIADLTDGLGPVGSPDGGVAGFRRATRALDRSLESVEDTARAFRGRRTGDLGAALRDASDLTRQLARTPDDLAGIVSSYRTVIGALAASDDELRAALPAADRLLQTAPAALRSIDRVLPSLRRFALDLRPVLRELPRQVPAVNRALTQVASTALPDELSRLVRLLDEPVTMLPTVERQLEFVTPYAGPIGRCLSKVVVPGLSQQVPDGPLTLEQPAWLELLHAFSGLAAASPAFDANGTTIRAGLAEGDSSLAGVMPGLKDTINILGGDKIVGVSPKWLGHGRRPTRRVDQPCEDQKIPDLSQMTQGVPFQGLQPGPTSRTTTPTPPGEITERLRGLRNALRGDVGPTRPSSETRSGSTGAAGGATNDGGRTDAARRALQHESGDGRDAR